MNLGPQVKPRKSSKHCDGYQRKKLVMNINGRCYRIKMLNFN